MATELEKGNKLRRFIFELRFDSWAEDELTAREAFTERISEMMMDPDGPLSYGEVLEVPEVMEQW